MSNEIFFIKGYRSRLASIEDEAKELTKSIDKYKSFGRASKCRFCGHTPDISVVDTFIDSNKALVGVQCLKCGAIGPKASYKFDVAFSFHNACIEALSLWNGDVL